MKILNVIWFSASTLTGIVQVETEYDGIKYYISSVPEITNEETDKQHIADWGTTFPKDAGDVLFGLAGVER